MDCKVCDPEGKLFHATERKYSKSAKYVDQFGQNAHN